MHTILDFIEKAIFRHRLVVLISFAIITCLLIFKATHIQLDASFNKNIPLNHEYMKVYTKHEKQFGGANSILISVCDDSGNIFNPEFFTQLKAKKEPGYISSRRSQVLPLSVLLASKPISPTSIKPSEVCSIRLKCGRIDAVSASYPSGSLFFKSFK